MHVNLEALFTASVSTFSFSVVFIDFQHRIFYFLVFLKMQKKYIYIVFNLHKNVKKKSIYLNIMKKNLMIRRENFKIYF